MKALALHQLAGLCTGAFLVEGVRSRSRTDTNPRIQALADVWLTLHPHNCRLDSNQRTKDLPD